MQVSSLNLHVTSQVKQRSDDVSQFLNQVKAILGGFALPVFLYYNIIFFWHHFRYETTCFSIVLCIRYNWDYMCTYEIEQKQSVLQGIYQHQHSSLLSFCFLSLLSQPQLQHYITRQISHHLQPTTSLCPSVSLLPSVLTLQVNRYCSFPSWQKIMEYKYIIFCVS